MAFIQNILNGWWWFEECFDSLLWLIFFFGFIVGLFVGSIR